MANFCGACGQRVTGRKFCTNCGTQLEGSSSVDTTGQSDAGPTPSSASQQPAPVTAPASPEPEVVRPPKDGATTAGPPPPPPPARSAAWTEPQAPSGTRSAPVVPRPSEGAVRSPFTGVPLGDYARDVVALGLLITSLTVPWDASHDTSERWWAVLAVITAIFAIPVPYLGASGLIPGLSRQYSRLLKLALLVPMALSAVAAVVNELVHAGEDEFSFGSPAGGLGVGLSMALAGALLAVVPRASEEPLSERGERAWWGATVTAAILTMTLTLITTLSAAILYVTSDIYELSDSTVQLLFLVSTLVVGVAGFLGFGLPAAMMAARRVGYRRVVIVVGLTTYAMSVVALMSLDDGSASELDLMFRPEPPTFFALVVEHWATPGAGMIVLGPLVALAWSHTAHRSTARETPLEGWLATARAALVIAMVVLGITIVASILENVLNDELGIESFPVAGVVLIVLNGVAVGLLAISLGLVSGRNVQRVALLILCAATIAVGVAYLAVVGSVETTDMFGTAHALGFFALPALVIAALTVPRSVREDLGPLLPESGAVAAGGGSDWERP